MALTKAQPSSGFFKPDNHVNDLVLIVEGKRIERDVPNEYQGVTTNRDIATCDIYGFRNSADVENREPSLVLKAVKVDKSVLVSQIEDNGWMNGSAGLARVVKPKRAWLWDSEAIDPQAEAAAVAWYEARENEYAAAADDMPSF